MPFSRNEVLNITADIICLFLLGLPLLLYNSVDVVPLSRIGFFCNDDSIRYPYKESTISTAVNAAVCCTSVVVLSICIQTWLYKKGKTFTTSTVFHPLLIELYRIIGFYFVGAAINQILTDIGKWQVGRLRPHFIDICQPSVNCTAENQHVYIANFQCLRTSFPPYVPANKMAERIDNARKSFPSGHASYCMYTAIYVTIYLEYQLRSRKTRLLRHLIQVAMLSWAIWVSSTRITDFKHRLSDVAGGMILGFFVAIATGYLYIRSARAGKKREHLNGRVTSVAADKASSSERRNSLVNIPMNEQV